MVLYAALAQRNASNGDVFKVLNSFLIVENSTGEFLFLYFEKYFTAIELHVWNYMKNYEEFLLKSLWLY